MFIHYVCFSMYWLIMYCMYTVQCDCVKAYLYTCTTFYIFVLLSYSICNYFLSIHLHVIDPYY